MLYNWWCMDTFIEMLSCYIIILEFLHKCDGVMGSHNTIYPLTVY